MWVLDSDTGEQRARYDLDEPVERPVRCHHELTSPFMDRETLVVCSRAAIYALDPAERDWRVLAHHPWMTDLHAIATRSAGGFWVTSTGIDALLAISETGELLDRIDLAEPVPGDDFRTTPYEALKPHQCHPNHVEEWGGATWVTCLHTQEVREVGGGRRISFPEGPPHDGRLREGLVWFTTVTGHIIAIDPVSLARVETYDLSALQRSPGLPGWCRGIEVVGDRIWVGMTQVRSSRMRELLRPLVRGARGAKLPTRVVEIARGEGTIVRETVMGGGIGTTIFGIRALTRDE